MERESEGGRVVCVLPVTKINFQSRIARTTEA